MTDYQRDVAFMNMLELEDPATPFWRKIQLWHHCWFPGCLRWKWKRTDTLCARHRREWRKLNRDHSKP